MEMAYNRAQELRLKAERKTQGIMRPLGGDLHPASRVFALLVSCLSLSHRSMPVRALERGFAPKQKRKGLFHAVV
jgi:hypothetical protein